MRLAIDRAKWFVRIGYLAPVLLWPLFSQFEQGVAAAVERTRFVWGLLPFPCLLFKDSFKIWEGFPYVCVAAFLISWGIPRLASAPAIAVWFGSIALLLAGQLYFAYLVVATFLR